MASLALQLLPKSKSFVHPNPRTFVHFFSSSSSDGSAESPDKPTSESSSSSSSSTSSFSSYFSDVKASLKQQQQQVPHQRFSQQLPRKPFSFSPPKPQSKVASLEEIRKNLSEFRRRTMPPPPPSGPAPPPSPSSSQHASSQELQNRNVNESSSAGKGGRLSFEAIRESLRQLRSTGPEKVGKMSLTPFRNSLRLRPPDRDSTTVIGGSDSFHGSIFGNELREKKEPEGDAATSSTELVKVYTYPELGEKLRNLRPKAEGENWFSFGELNERLGKLRETELKESETKFHGVSFKDLRDSLVKLRISEDNKARRSTIQRLDVLGQMRGTPSFMLSPPKEHLVEKYFHLDNMSASEKFKIELQKIRDEFKISDCDCGSTEVQVAQLTARIKYLNSILPRKNKHGQRRVMMMVGKRKKLLRYLRRSHWDSYCFVISKLGLRDTPPLPGKME